MQQSVGDHRRHLLSPGGRAARGVFYNATSVREGLMSTPLITVADLLTRLAQPAGLVVVDCRFDLANPAAGRLAYRAGHIPGAAYAHLDEDLSGAPHTDCGRHPLPSEASLRALFGRLGIARDSVVVAYDDMGGALAAARLWWLLRQFDHPQVMVLDGGWTAWLRAGGAQVSGHSQVPSRDYPAHARWDRRVLLTEMNQAWLLVDARDPVRFRGEQEPIDPVAGHIPGARNHFWRNNLTADGCFLSRDALREAFKGSLGTLPDADTVHYCGSGVSACHNVLAQVHAGLAEPRIYCGSWSEWCRDPARPVATGPASA